MESLFQFQYGTIKSYAKEVQGSRRFLCFNSNMVRLKVEPIITELTEGEMFQFQYGTIKSWTNLKKVILSFVRFNSNMVRLKV